MKTQPITLAESLKLVSEQLDKLPYKHTETPWTFEMRDGKFIVLDKLEIPICFVCDKQTLDKGNALLISAAPLLLEAVKRALLMEKSNHGMTSHAHFYQKTIDIAEGIGLDKMLNEKL